MGPAYSDEQEQLNHLDSASNDAFSHRLRNLPLELLVAPLEPEASEAVQRLVGSGRRVLLVGGTVDWATAVKPTHALAINACHAETLNLPWLEVVKCVGVSVPFPTRSFDTAIVSDLLRALPAVVADSVVTELARVSRQLVGTFLVRDTSHSVLVGSPTFREASGWRLLGIDALVNRLAAHGYSIKVAYRSRYVLILECLLDASVGPRHR